MTAVAATQRVELRDVKRVARRRIAVEQDFRAAIVKAHAAGATLRQIAFAADLSHVRILQIVREENGIRPAKRRPAAAQD